MFLQHTAPLYILGHTNPDTDAIVSSIAYAQFLHDKGQDAKAISLGSANNETSFVLQQAGVPMPEITDELNTWSSLILVDHNEEKQSIRNRREHTLLGVIDHHKFGGFVTQAPLHMRIEPLGSTASILTKIFDEHQYTISPQLATLLAGAIISDTLYLQSPTTTEQDRELLEKLQNIAQIGDMQAFAMDMFAAKSDLGTTPARDIVTMDYKTFDLGTHRGGIGVIETTNPSYALGKKTELLEAMEEVKKEDNLDFLLLCVVDILQQHTQAFILGDTEASLVTEAYKASINEDVADLGNRVSRKKQLVPPLAALFDA